MQTRTIHVSESVYSTLEALAEDRGESIDELAEAVFDSFFDYQLNNYDNGFSYPEDISEELPEIS